MKKKQHKQFRVILQIWLVVILLLGNAPLAIAIEQQNDETINASNISTINTNDRATSDEQTEEPSQQNQVVSDHTTTETNTLTILGTSDVHGQLWNWSYEDDQQTPVGLAQVSSVVKNIRHQNPQGTLLIDNGDMNQGTILTDDLYNKEPFIQQKNPMIQAMNYMQYDAMVLGNHEFNFGTDLIKKIQSEAQFPLLSGNTYIKETQQHFVESTTTKEIDWDNDGITDLTVGIIGLTIPHIPYWDGAKVTALQFNPLKEEAEKAVSQLQGQADIIVASIHAGRENSDPAASADEVIANVAGIDAYILGHDHRSFSQQVQGPNGLVPVAGPKDTGTEMVRIDLEVSKNNDQWQVNQSQAAIIDTKNVDADEDLKTLTQDYHDQTRAFISNTIGTASADFLPQQEIKGIPEAQLQPTAMISLINNVQRKITGAQLSASALFKYDSKLPAGELSYSNIFDIYKYPNTLVSVNITGKNLLTYMENQANYYNAYSPDDLTISFNPDIRVYNYDIFSGISYKIDISKPVGERIIQPTIDGAPVDPNGTYTIAMNNYRYEGLLAQGIVTEEPLYSSDPETLRGLIADYIREKGTIHPDEEIEENWEIIGYQFDRKWRDLAIELINNDILTIESAGDGRTPNVKSVTKQDVLNAGYSPDTLTIMHTNDIHGRMEGNQKDVLGMARLKTYKNQIQPDLLIDVGDAIQGLPISNFSQGKDMITIMNAVGYDAMVIGNHEFDFGLETIQSYQEQMTFPLLSSNTFKDGKTLFQPYTIIEKNGKNYAVIGVTTPETATKTHPNNIVGVTFTEPITETEKIIQTLENSEQTIDAYIVTGHLGIDETTPNAWRGDTLAKRLSQTFTDLNITVLDGHSHTEVKEGLHFGNVLYAQTGNYLNNVGLATISLSDNSQKSASLVSAETLATLPEDEAVKTLVDQAKVNFDTWGSEIVIKNNPYLFDGNRENVRTRETNLGNLIGDAMLDYGQTGFSQPTDFAVLNGGDIRQNIEEGPVTLADITAVLPFGNSIVQVKVTGAQIKEMFELSLRSAAQKDADGNIILDDAKQPKLGANGGFLQVSSTIHIYYDSTKQGTLLPEDDENTTGQTQIGSRVLRIEIQNKETGQFEPLKDSATYYMATNDFLAAGGDGYSMLIGQKEEGASVDSVVIDYLKQMTALDTSRTTKALSLSQYENPFPEERIISMSETTYNQKFNTQKNPKPELKPEIKPKTDIDSEGVQPLSATRSPKTGSRRTQLFPKTGETIQNYTVIVLLLLFIIYSQLKRKKKTI